MSQFWRTLRMICMGCETLSWRRMPPGRHWFYCEECGWFLMPVYKEGKEHRNPHLQ